MINQIQLTGTLVQNFEIKQTSNGSNYLVGALAVNGARNSKTQNFDYSVEPEYYNLIIFFNSIVEKAQYFKKGLFVTITGDLERQCYTDSVGMMKFRNKITIKDINPYIQGGDLAQVVVKAILEFKQQRAEQRSQGFNNQSQSFNTNPNQGFNQNSSFNQSQSFSNNINNNRNSLHQGNTLGVNDQTPQGNNFWSQSNVNNFATNNANNPLNFGSAKEEFNKASNNNGFGSFKQPQVQKQQNTQQLSDPDDIPF